MTKGKSNAGRVSIFRGKKDGVRVQGIITKIGAQELERNRERLAMLYEEIVGHEPVSVSDADVIEYLARGELGTKTYLREHVQS